MNYYTKNEICLNASITESQIKHIISVLKIKPIDIILDGKVGGRKNVYSSEDMNKIINFKNNKHKKNIVYYPIYLTIGIETIPSKLNFLTLEQL